MPQEIYETYPPQVGISDSGFRSALERYFMSLRLDAICFQNGVMSKRIIWEEKEKDIQ